MAITRSNVRWWATRAFLALAGAILLGVIAQWFIQVATDKGWYAHAGQAWDRFVTTLLAFLTSSPVFALALLSGGFVAGLWLDAYLVQRSTRRWWHNVQAFSIRDAACLVAGAKRSDFEKSDRAVAIANELRGYVNSGHVPLFLEFEYERADPDFSDPKAKYEPPYDKKDVDFDAVIGKRFIEGMARGRKWPLPWPLPPKDEKEFGKPFPRPKAVPHSSVPTVLSLGKAMGMFAAGAKEHNMPTIEGEEK